MAIITNKNTTQAPMTAVGQTGAQSVRFIPACRVYIKAADSTSAAPIQTYFTKSNGVTPTGWTDLGTMLGAAKLTYNKDTNKLKTGIDKVTRFEYVTGKEAMLDFNLAQFDDAIMTQISGLTASIITSGSIVSFGIGQEDIVEKALLCVCQNKLDGKEHQFYHPSAKINFELDEVEDGWALKVNADFCVFTALGQTVEEIFRHSIFA
jgi:hypothetical protein